MVAILAGAVLLVACGGGDDAPAGEQADDAVRQEIAEAAEGFYEAFANGDVEKLAAYWSQTCDQASIEAATAASVSGASFFEGGLDVTVDSGALVVRVISDDHVVIDPADQPAGTFSGTVGGRTIESGDPEEAQGDPLELVREGGVWRVANCAAFAPEGG
ncbi:MAG: hypothetical protein A2148_01150 [Chloroflexi bacterium RBG_16_68_14]|nr:MAG: hypothetical protein A2148_01150 [Chloroflexi bacterium RBG_16_68_14]